MGRRTTLPEPLRGRAFTVTEAKAYGITARLRWLHRPFHGIRSESSCDTVLERARALQQALPPESAFCDTTAIDLLELPLPPAHANGRLLQVMTPSDRPLIRHRDTRGHRGLETRRVTTAHGLRVLAAVEAWLDLSPAWSLRTWWCSAMRFWRAIRTRSRSCEPVSGPVRAGVGSVGRERRSS